MTRRLATILAADAVGFSARMEQDEEATLALLTTLRRKIDSEIQTHGGRVFGSAGDSVIAEFDSPVEAVRCAAEQRLLCSWQHLPPLEDGEAARASWVTRGPGHYHVGPHAEPCSEAASR